jgi:molecular chaperone GrpE
VTPDLPEIDPERVVIRDKRRIDPETGQARRPMPGPAVDVSSPVGVSSPAVDVSDAIGTAGSLLDPAEPAEPAAEPNEFEVQLAERTADLQRVQAEFANYRKRIERDRETIGELAVGGVLAALLPVLDDLDRARQHGDLSGALKAVSEQLDTLLGKLGLVPFGEAGDAFDPVVHEAVMHSESDEVDVPTATTVMRKGYKHGERLLRPAMVAVSEPAAPTDLDAVPDPDAVPDLDAQRES